MTGIMPRVREEALNAKKEFGLLHYRLQNLPAASRARIQSVYTQRLIDDQLAVETPLGPLSFVLLGRSSSTRAMSLLTKQPETIAWIDAFSPNSVFWDVGANVGVYSLYAALRPGTKIVAFEPAAINYFLLAANVEANNLDKQVDCLLVGLSNERAIAHLEVSQFMPANSFSFRGKKNKPYPGRQAALMVSVDQLIEDYGLECPNYIKIDCTRADRGNSGWRRANAATERRARGAHRVFPGSERWAAHRGKPGARWLCRLLPEPSRPHRRHDVYQTISAIVIRAARGESPAAFDWRRNPPIREDICGSMLHPAWRRSQQRKRRMASVTRACSVQVKSANSGRRTSRSAAHSVTGQSPGRPPSSAPIFGQMQRLVVEYGQDVRAPQMRDKPFPGLRRRQNHVEQMERVTASLGYDGQADIVLVGPAPRLSA